MELKKATISVEGRSCHHCEMGVEKNLKKLDGVASASASAAHGRVEVEFDPALVDETALKAAVEDRGFTVTEIKA